MKRIVLAFATSAMLIAGSFAILSAGPVGTAKAHTLKRHAAHRGRYAPATVPAPGSSTGYGTTGSGTRYDTNGPSIRYDPNGPAYLPGQTKTKDFQLQH